MLSNLWHFGHQRHVHMHPLPPFMMRPWGSRGGGGGGDSMHATSALDKQAVISRYTKADTSPQQKEGRDNALCQCPAPTTIVRQPQPGCWPHRGWMATPCKICWPLPEGKQTVNLKAHKYSWHVKQCGI